MARFVENRLFWAGGGAHENHSGCAHGAYISGVRAAGEITPLGLWTKFESYGIVVDGTKKIYRL
jgi:hypothetical protein